MNFQFKFTGPRVCSLGLLAVCGLLSSLSATPAWAQSTATGTVSGQVVDQTNAAIVGADVKLIDTEKTTTRTTVTNDAGRYVFVNVAPGTYDLTVSREGFQQFKATAQRVSVGLVLTVNVTLQVGSSMQSIEVKSTMGAELQTTNAAIGTTVSAKHLEMLTNLGRDANVLFVMQPVTAPGGQVAGAVQDQSTFQLDGANNSSDMDGTHNVYTQAAGFIGSAATGGTPSGVLPTPAESIEEFKVATVNQTADFNGSGGGQISLVTKRGTDHWHGASYWHYLGSNFGANSWSNNRAGRPLPSTHQNRYGVAGGGPLAPSFLGGKTYFYANFEGRRFPQGTTFEKPVPTALLRAGVIQVPDANGIYQPYNLNPVAVTVNGVTYQPARCGSTNALCDPRSIGLNSLVSQVWNRFLPLPNNPLGGDQFNTQGYRTNILLPISTDFGVARIDHDFGPKWRYNSSYRVYRLNQFATTQVDIGGLLAGSLGQAVSTAPRVQKPWTFIAGLTTTITPHFTNDFHYNYLRNYWEWGTAGAPPQPIPGLAGALEIGGESANALIPYNVNTQNVRQRFWDGHDHYFRDDLTWLRGTHMLQFGGLYQRNWDYHQRNDNGQGIMAANVYQIVNNPGVSMTGFRPSTLPSAQNSTWDLYYAEVLGIVGQPQSLYTRSLPNLSLLPLGTPASDKSIIPTYNLYFSDTWHIKPSFTLTYGLGYIIEMPPFENLGKQVMLVDSAGAAIRASDYLAQRRTAALAGQVFNPRLGFAILPNVSGNRKYPYDPYYKGLSPRVAAAWNPRFDSGILGTVFGPGRTVVRAGYSRILGRLNGVGLVLVPLLGTGLMQAVSCQGAVRSTFAVGGNQCLGTSGANPNSAFRIGTDGLTAPLPTAAATLPQPYFPGVGGNAAAGDGTALDPTFKPNRSDEFTLAIQRELIPTKLYVEFGYVGRRIRNEAQLVDLDAVAHMTTLSGQTFARAFGNLYTSLCGLGPTCAGTFASPVNPIQAQPFFEAVMGGPTSAYCTGFASCTAAVASRQASNIGSNRVYDLWNALATSTSWTLGRTLPSSNPVGGCVAGSAICQQLTSIFMETSIGYGNYHGAFISLTANNWHGMTARSNFTWSRALGTGAVTQSTSSFSVVDPYNVDSMYGSQSFDLRFVYNLSIVYEPPYFKNNKGILGHVLGGWAVSPLLTVQSGLPIRVGIQSGVNGQCQSFGEMNCSSGGTYENAVFTGPYTGGNSAHFNQTITGTIGRNTNAANGGSGINMFSDPAAVYNGFRRLILGVDTGGGGFGRIRGLPRWNLDFSVQKKFRFGERMGLQFLAQFANVLNHFQPGDPSVTLDTPQSWGHITGEVSTPRQIEFGLRFHF